MKFKSSRAPLNKNIGLEANPFLVGQIWPIVLAVAKKLGASAPNNPQRTGVLELARSKWMEGSGLTAEQKELIWSSLEDFGAYQKHFHPGDAVPDLSWQAALPSAGREYLEWVEKMCYGQEHDAGLKNMVLAGAQAADLAGIFREGK